MKNLFKPLLIIVFMIAPVTLYANPTQRDELDQLRRELEETKRELRETVKKIAEISEKLGQQRRVANTYRYIGNQDHAVIGIVMAPNRDRTNETVKIVGVTPGGPADNAGIQTGDIIIEINNESLSSRNRDKPSPVEKAYNLLDDLKEGDKIEITYERDKKQNKTIITAKRMEPQTWTMSMHGRHGPNFDFDIALPQFDGMPIPLENMHKQMEHAEEIAKHARENAKHAQELSKHARIYNNLRSGFSLWRQLKLVSLNKGIGRYFGTEDGVLILHVREGSSLNLQAGDVIKQIGDKKVRQPKNLMRILKQYQSGDEVSLKVIRDKKEMDIKFNVPKSDTRQYHSFNHFTEDEDFDFMFFGE